MTTTQYQGWIEDKVGGIIEPPQTFDSRADAERFVTDWMREWRNQPPRPGPALEFRFPKVAEVQAPPSTG